MVRKRLFGNVPGGFENEEFESYDDDDDDEDNGKFWSGHGEVER